MADKETGLTLIDVTKLIRDFDGNPLDLDDKPMTVRAVAVTVLIAQFREQKTEPDEALRQFVLAQHLSEADQLELSAEQITLILGLVSKAFGPLVYGRMTEVLDPARVRKVAAGFTNA